MKNGIGIEIPTWSNRMNPLQLSSENVKYVLSILHNAKNLADEAQILFEHKRYRRSMLLSLLSYEEYIKVGLLSKGHTKVFNHRTKFQSINDTIVGLVRENLEKMVAENISDNGWMQLSVSITSGDLTPEAEAKVRETLLEEMIKNLPEKIGEIFDFKTLREHLMYVDPGTNDFTKAFIDPANAERAAKAFLELAQAHISYISGKIPGVFEKVI
jgi:AbiV family abortive infection protein